MMRQPAAYEIIDAAFWLEKGALSTMWDPTMNSMPVAIRNGLKAFDAGYNEGIDDRPKEKE